MYAEVKTILKIIIILLIFALVCYAIYHFVAEHFKKVEAIQHRKNEEAVMSIEVMKGSTKEMLGGSGNYYIIRFELEEGKLWRVENIVFKYEFWDLETRKFVFSLYCNEQPYESIQKFFLGEGTSYSFNFKCEDWGTVNYFYVSVKPLLIKKEVRWLNLETEHKFTAEIQTNPILNIMRIAINDYGLRLKSYRSGSLMGVTKYDLILNVEIKVYKVEKEKTSE